MVFSTCAELIRQPSRLKAIDDGDWFIARIGYTCDYSLVIMLPADEAQRFFNELIGASISPYGLGARDTLRLEVGRISKVRTPANIFQRGPRAWLGSLPIVISSDVRRWRVDEQQESPSSSSAWCLKSEVVSGAGGTAGFRALRQNLDLTYGGFSADPMLRMTK